MSTADKVWDNVKAVLDMAEKKTTKAYELSKKKIWEKKLEDKLDGLYISLGKIYYASQKKGSSISDEEVQKTIVLIDNTKAELKSVRDEIKAMRYGKICPSCGAGMKKDDDFCGKCGTELK